MSIIYQALRRIEQRATPTTEQVAHLAFPKKTPTIQGKRFFLGRLWKQLVRRPPLWGGVFLLGIMLVRIIFMQYAEISQTTVSVLADQEKNWLVTEQQHVTEDPLRYIPPQPQTTETVFVTYTPSPAPVDIVSQSVAKKAESKHTVVAQHVKTEGKNVVENSVKALIAPTAKKQSTMPTEQLVDALNGAISLADTEKVVLLLGQLEQRMSPDAPFLLQLKAYWALKQQRYTDVKKILTPFVAKYPNDLNAGLNMSLAELHLNKTAALRRLQHLQKIYPDNQRVKHLLTLSNKN